MLIIYTSDNLVCNAVDCGMDAYIPINCVCKYSIYLIVIQNKELNLHNFGTILVELT